MKIKTLLFAIFAIFSVSNVAPRVLADSEKIALADADLLTQSKTRYARISRNLSRFRMVKRALNGSTEGGELVAYFKGNAPQCLIATYYGETGKVRSEYFFDKGRLFFAHRSEDKYVEPLGYDQPTLPIGTVRIRTDERFYFADGRLFRRVVEVRETKKNPRSSVTNGDLPKDRTEAARVLAAARDLLRRAKTPQK